MHGFCPDGPNCTMQHVRSFIQPTDISLMLLANFPEEENWIDKALHHQI
jgi:hypothetical protein